MTDDLPENTLSPNSIEPDSVSSEEQHRLEESALTDPQGTLDHIRQKMESVAEEFASGKINRAQFNAIYKYHSEQRDIIERIKQRNPESDAWKQVADQGRTTFLRSHFKAVPSYYIIFRHRVQKPIYYDGEHPKNNTQHIVGALRQLWSLKQIPSDGLARKEIGNNHWMVIAVGKHSTTIVIYTLQPSADQATLVSDLHKDFERANRLSLARGVASDRLVFPQKALLK